MPSHNVKYGTKTMYKRDADNKYCDIINIDRETTDILEITIAFIFIANNYVTFDKVRIKHCRVIGSLKN